MAMKSWILRSMKPQYLAQISLFRPWRSNSAVVIMPYLRVGSVGWTAF